MHSKLMLLLMALKLHASVRLISTRLRAAGALLSGCLRVSNSVLRAGLVKPLMWRHLHYLHDVTIFHGIINVACNYLIVVWCCATAPTRQQVQVTAMPAAAPQCSLCQFLCHLCHKQSQLPLSQKSPQSPCLNDPHSTWCYHQQRRFPHPAPRSGASCVSLTVNASHVDATPSLMCRVMKVLVHANHLRTIAALHSVVPVLITLAGR